MAYAVDILDRRSSHFVFWLPGLEVSAPPKLLLGTFSENGSKNEFQQLVRQPFVAVDGKPGLWLLDPNDLQPGLTDGTVYHYWFQLGGLTVTDPIAFTVDYSYLGLENAKARSDSVQPPTVVKFRDGKLWACDVDGQESARTPIPTQSSLPSNNHMVIYELPTSWARASTQTDRANESGAAAVKVDVGSFADVTALFDVNARGQHYGSDASHAILQELGINALELLPPADAKPKGDWGYATAHYFAPDYDLGTASQLAVLSETINKQGVRMFTDVVMAFGHDSYGDVYGDDTRANVFHLDPNAEPENPDSYEAGTTGGQKRDGFGGRPWRYIKTVDGYDPESGDGDTTTPKTVQPAWAFHRAHLTRWMVDFGVGGLRLDSLNNVGSWDFVKSYRERAWALYNQRYGGDADKSKFLIVGEELSMPVDMLTGGCLDALWNEKWQQRARAAVLGESWGDDDFEWTVRKLVDCRQDQLNGGSFSDGSQAVNYLTSHDIEGYRKNRMYDFLADSGVTDTLEIEKRAKLAFVLLLTSVGVPMIFAGEEFADQQDQSQDMARKQTDPVNYERKNDGGWRQALFTYVALLTKFRTACPALGVDDTNIFHVDASRGGKVLAWSRGGGTDAAEKPVVVVANFSDQDIVDEYVVPSFPDKDVAGWREVTHDRDVPAEWIGREPLYAWEAKVYTYWRG
ncbi:alpha amylase catalytic region [Ophiostoma piceae UAMH 11346]|uniref:Alpha amylase catalytic region n=1 Tax=Ophiostoma piceae (strain UAMH 11346) TaxID=1262450 RepID=S3C266_OPHP1|nr:alpha amylase catalytic region [Ophiostoma piceae UAMH 11346]